jgi:diguanylate cyclase (GGDEF)-like protein/PAS domain S-box-containing protein
MNCSFPKIAQPASVQDAVVASIGARQDGDIPARILIIDDNASVLEVFHKILVGESEGSSEALDALEASVFATEVPTAQKQHRFVVDGVQDGEQGCNNAREARSKGHPYAVAFVDMRMPGGWDGLKTIEALWQADPDIQVVICTAYTEFSLDDITARLGRSDRLLILRKPFDKIEVLQLAYALSDKWRLQREQQARMDELEQRVTERTRHLQLALSERQRAEQELDQFFTLAPDILCVIGAGGNFKRLNSASQQTLGYSIDELQGHPFTDVLHPDDKDKANEEIRRLTSPGGGDKRSTFEIRTRARNGDYRWIEWNLVAPENKAVLYGAGRDVTERQEAEQTRKRLAAVLEGTTDIIFFADPTGRVLYLNRIGRELFGIPHAENIRKSAYDFYPSWANEIIRNQGFPTAVREGAWRGETVVLAPDGREIPVSQVIEAHQAPSGEVGFFSAILRDISEHKAYEMRLQFQATHDALTGLPNRNLVEDRIGNAITLMRRTEQRLAVLFLDLDRFKFINDSFGHLVGDALLKAVAGRLQGVVRESDTVARLGGDEFVMMLSGITRMEDVQGVVQKVIAAFAPPFQVEGHEFHVTASIGVSVYPDDGETSEMLLRNADAAMYRAKDQGRDSFQIYTQEMGVQAQERIVLEHALHGALERQEFQLHYQPKVDLASGRVHGMEALIRWNHPELGVIPPDRFIPLAEETGMIIQMGEWVLETACAQIKAWHADGHADLSVAVNLSARQFRQQNLPELVRRVLLETGLAASHLELELTESLLMQDCEDVIEALRELKAIGVTLSLDDFGTGYSSLSYLKRFPIDTVKIDKTFIRDITSSVDSASLTKAIIAMAQSLNMKTVAEGVETNGQLAFLSANSCDGIQGYYFSRPLPSGDITALLREGKHLPAINSSADVAKETLLLVDDNQLDTELVRRALRDEGYQILTAENARDALELLAVNSIGVVVTDARMPEMSGVDFLRHVKELYPHVVRIMLSGDTELQSVTDAINEGAVYKFFTKPCVDGFLQKNIADAFRRFEMSSGNDH